MLVSRIHAVIMEIVQWMAQTTNVLARVLVKDEIVKVGVTVILPIYDLVTNEILL